MCPASVASERGVDGHEDEPRQRGRVGEHERLRSRRRPDRDPLAGLELRGQRARRAFGEIEELGIRPSPPRRRGARRRRRARGRRVKPRRRPAGNRRSSCRGGTSPSVQMRGHRRTPPEPSPGSFRAAGVGRRRDAGARAEDERGTDGAAAARGADTERAGRRVPGRVEAVDEPTVVPAYPSRCVGARSHPWCRGIRA